MFKKVVVLAIFLMVCVGGLLGFAEEDVGDGSVPYPVDAEYIKGVFCFYDEYQKCCAEEGCPETPELLFCWCTSDGWVVCMYILCVYRMWPPCCSCEVIFVYPGIRCTPGEPVPQWTPPDSIRRI